MLKAEIQNRKKWGFCRSFCTKLKEIYDTLKQALLPFEVVSSSGMKEQAFYYPQRLLTPMFISTLSIVYLVYTMYLLFGEAGDM